MECVLQHRETTIGALMRRARKELSPSSFEALRKLEVDLRARNLAKGTVYTLLDRALIFLKWLQERGVGLETVDADLVREFLASKSEGGT